MISNSILKLLQNRILDGVAVSWIQELEQLYKNVIPKINCLVTLQPICCYWRCRRDDNLVSSRVTYFGENCQEPTEWI